MNTADLLIDATGPEIHHRSGVTAPDAFVYLGIQGDARVFFDAREYSIQQKKLLQANNGVHIEQLEPYMQGTKSFTEVLNNIFTKHAISRVRISAEMPYRLVQVLQTLSIPFEVYDFSAERLQKTEQEIMYLKDAQDIVNGGFDVVQTILKNSTIVGNFLEYEGVQLTSERIKTAVQIYYLEKNYSCPDGIIVASKEQGSCPHDEGSGPIFANEAIVVDMFPRSNATGYYADMTRTFVKGTPSTDLVRQYEAVQIVQAEAVNMINVGTACRAVYTHCVDRFKELGFVTTTEEGFTHSTGHGIGLGLHEAPRLGNNDIILAAGMAVTVEPGLYYKATGGVRIEDVVVLHTDGTPENINTYSKDWIIS